MTPIPLTSPQILTQQPTAGLAIAYTPKQQVVENLKAIDITRLNAGRAKQGGTSYDVKELRAIAGSLDLPKSGNKKELVERIKTAYMKLNPNAFN